MMKKLIVVGNKPIEQDLSKEIDNFDFVIRVNRMNNYGNTGSKTDFLAVDPHNEFFELVQKPFDKFNNAKKLIINTFFFSPKAAAMLLQKGIFKRQQLSEAIKICFQDYRRNLVERYVGYDDNSINFTNFFIMLCYAIEFYSKDYQIWFTGIDVNGRGDMMKTNDIWIENHSHAGEIEERLLKEFIDNNTIHQL